MCLAVPGKILSIDGDDPLLRQGRVEFAGIVKQANLAYVPEARPGDFVLVHAGFAIALIDEAQALATLVWLAEGLREEPR
jgi:hydrogenase expression/formation protein HypC